MWAYQYFLKNGEEKNFYTDEPFTPNEVIEFLRTNKDNIDDSFVDHYTVTVKEFLENF